MPDISILYKLHLEYGKLINLYDWLQSFLSIVDPDDSNEEEGKRVVKPELQYPFLVTSHLIYSIKTIVPRYEFSLNISRARFTQGVADLEYLGFIKSSKRKTDFVVRLTWGG